jgi:hypothetical protein
MTRLPWAASVTVGVLLFFSLSAIGDHTFAALVNCLLAGVTTTFMLKFW